MKWLVVGVHPHSSHIHKVFESIREVTYNETLHASNARAYFQCQFRPRAGRSVVSGPQFRTSAQLAVPVGAFGPNWALSIQWPLALIEVWVGMDFRKTASGVDSSGGDWLRPICTLIS